MTLTIRDLDRAAEDERWLGYGYTGERSRRADGTYRHTAADRAVVRRANALGWDYEALFHWTNSKYGRWTGEARDLDAAEVARFIENYMTAAVRAELLAAEA